MELPLELIEIFLSFFNDTKTYMNCRLVSILWYDILIDGKIFKDGKFLEKVIFRENLIQFLDLSNNLNAECVFQNYSFKFKNYKSYNNETIILKGFNLVSKYSNFNYTKEITYNMITNEKKHNEIKHHMRGCLMM